MHYHSVYRWLERNTNEVNISQQSVYFKIGEYIVRYSNHFSHSSKCNICIVETDDYYILTVEPAKIPQVYKKTERAKLKKLLLPVLNFWKMSTGTGKKQLPDIHEANMGDPKLMQIAEVAANKDVDLKQLKTVSAKWFSVLSKAEKALIQTTLLAYPELDDDFYKKVGPCSNNPKTRGEVIKGIILLKTKQKV